MINNKARMPAFTTLIQYCTENLSQCIKARKINKIHMHCKERNKTPSICT